MTWAELRVTALAMLAGPLLVGAVALYMMHQDRWCMEVTTTQCVWRCR